VAAAASLVSFALAALGAPPRNVARDGPGPPGDPATVAIALVASLGGVALLLTLVIVGVVVSVRRERARLEATRATGIGCTATVLGVDATPGGNHKLSLRISMPPGAAGTAGGIVATTAVVRFASDDARARAWPGATIAVRVSRDAPLRLLVDAPGVETL
jgi:hypothetical protein